MLSFSLVFVGVATWVATYCLVLEERNRRDLDYPQDKSVTGRQWEQMVYCVPNYTLISVLQQVI